MKRRRFSVLGSASAFSHSAKNYALDGLGRLGCGHKCARAEPSPPGEPFEAPVHWRAASNNTWRWYERENLVDGRWKLTGITTPVHKKTGQPYTGHTGYLDDSLVPIEIRDDARIRVISRAPPAWSKLWRRATRT